MITKQLSECSRTLSKPVFETIEDPLSARSEGSPEASLLDAKGLFVATVTTVLIRQAFTHIQNLLTFLTLTALFLLWGLNSYPFQPSGLISVLMVGLFIWLVLSSCFVFLKFNRNEILSRLADTPPNEFTVDKSLILPVITYAVIPLISLLAVEFPGFGNFLFAWVEGVRQAVR